jgi:hypothetical protein
MLYYSGLNQQRNVTMGKYWVLLGLIGLFVVSSNAYAVRVTGHDLVEYVKDYKKAVNEDPKANYFNPGQLMGYVLAVADVSSTLDTICAYSATNGQLVAVVSKYIDEHPKEWSQDAAIIIIRALAEAFPCSD